jgi:DNA-directed RNA polymerase subunit RPC12/RpoP
MMEKCVRCSQDYVHDSKNLFYNVCHGCESYGVNDLF